jgi:hypothetical protein
MLLLLLLLAAGREPDSWTGNEGLIMPWGRGLTNGLSVACPWQLSAATNCGDGFLAKAPGLFLPALAGFPCTKRVSIICRISGTRSAASHCPSRLLAVGGPRK